MSRPRPFQQVDVFTATPYQGNPVAVVLDGEGLSTQEMQAFTNWTNLSEATFILPPQDARADYRLRIFCPGQELPFAGHPTLGSAHAWLRAGGRPQGQEIIQECGVGLVRLRRQGTQLAFAAPPLQRSGPLEEDKVTLIASGLGLRREDIAQHAWCDNGPPWQAVMLRSHEQLLALKPDTTLLRGLFVGAVAPTGQREPAFEVRAFFPGPGGMAEDPVTGSLNAALAQWLIGEGLAPSRYVAAQGQALGREGRILIEQANDEARTIWVGGESVSCIDGQVML